MTAAATVTVVRVRRPAARRASTCGSPRRGRVTHQLPPPDHRRTSKVYRSTRNGNGKPRATVAAAGETRRDVGREVATEEDEPEDLVSHRDTWQSSSKERTIRVIAFRSAILSTAPKSQRVSPALLLNVKIDPPGKNERPGIDAWIKERVTSWK